MSTPDHKNAIVLATWMYTHHNASSGYGQLCNYIDANCLRSTDLPLARAPEGSLRWQIGRKLFDAKILATATRADLVHVLYAENHLRLMFTAIRRVRARCLGTVHLPLDYYSLPRSVAALGELDGIITLTSDQAEEVQSHLPGKVVRFIPHGFVADHPYRNPLAHDEDSGFNVAVVGSNYRNWAVLKSVMQQAADRHPGWRFHLVGVPAGKRAEFGQLANAIIHERLAEPEYYGVLNRAQVLFMPVTFATANNSLLEAHSVGLPSLCSELPAVRDYATSTTRFFTVADEAVARLETLAASSPEERAVERVRTIEEGRRFGWDQIAPQIIRMYEDVLGSHHDRHA